MKKKPKQPDLYWHVHHMRLFEWCWDYNERKDHINKYKPKGERATRLKWFQPIKGKLPIGLCKARDAAKKAAKAYDGAKKAYNKAGKARDKADGRLGNLLSKNQGKLEALHAKEHPNCPWDGETLVFHRKRKKKKQ